MKNQEVSVLSAMSEFVSAETIWKFPSAALAGSSISGDS